MLSVQEAIRRNANYFTDTKTLYVANNNKKDYVFFLFSQQLHLLG